MAPDQSEPRSTGKARVFLVDDHPVVREGLACLIDHERDMMVCGETDKGVEALRMVGQLHPDMVVVDISLKDITGLELIKDLKSRFPDLAMLALSMYDESVFAERALRAGARGYIMKDEAPEVVVSAIRKVLSGRLYLSERIAGKLLSSFVSGTKIETASPQELLSDRELEVFWLIGEGLATREIADRLHLSIKTIETYRGNIKEKLHLQNATELLQHAIRWSQSVNG